MNDTITKKVDSAAHISDEYRCIAPPCPRSVKIELTGRCDYRCAYCALSVRKEQPQHDMDWWLFSRITKEMMDSGVKEIGLFYIGESFINPGLLIRAVHFLKDELDTPYVFLTSNGSLAAPRHVSAVMEAGLDSLKWSCNAADEDQFKKLMRVGVSSFQRMKDNIHSAWAIRKANNFRTRLYASSIRYNDDQVERMRPFLEEYVLPFVDEHYWLPLYSMGDLATPEEHRQGIMPTPGNRGRYDNPADPLPCWAAFTVGHVLCDGRLTACCFDATGNWVMGDLRVQSFMQAWNSPAFQELRAAHLAKNVRDTNCWNCAML